MSHTANLAQCHIAVLPPGEFNGIIPQQLTIYSAVSRLHV